MIRGYRELTPEELQLIDVVKLSGIELEKLVDRLMHIDSVDKRWISIARTDLQKGMMCLVRSIAKPTGF